MLHSSSWLCMHIHKVHHRFPAPTGMASVYAHPVEFCLANVLPIYLGPILANAHPKTCYIWWCMSILGTHLQGTFWVPNLRALQAQLRWHLCVGFLVWDTCNKERFLWQEKMTIPLSIQISITYTLNFLVLPMFIPMFQRRWIDGGSFWRGSLSSFFAPNYRCSPTKPPPLQEVMKWIE